GRQIEFLTREVEEAAEDLGSTVAVLPPPPPPRQRFTPPPGGARGGGPPGGGAPPPTTPTPESRPRHRQRPVVADSVAMKASSPIPEELLDDVRGTTPHSLTTSMRATRSHLELRALPDRLTVLPAGLHRDARRVD
ncbi:hypothetical protein ACFV23_19985, partial [Streptomyces sp. NPDC059627]